MVLPVLPGLSVLAHQADEGLHLGLGDVLLQQLSVVMKQSSDGVFSQDVVPDLTLHYSKLLGYVLLQGWGASVKMQEPPGHPSSTVQ